MAHECGIEFDLFDVAEIFKKTPYIADLKPGGKYVASDVHEIGGVPQILKALLDGGILHGDCLTVTGKTMAENLASVTFNTDQKVVYPVSNPISPTGGVVGLKGSLAPDGAIVKVAGLKNLKFRGPARCFDCEEDAFAAVDARQYSEGEVLVIRYEGPKGGPGMREMLATTAALYGQGAGDKCRAHHRWALLGRDARFLRRPRGTGSRRGRPHRAHPGRRHHFDGRRGRHARLSRSTPAGTRTPAQDLEGAAKCVPERSNQKICGSSGPGPLWRRHPRRRESGNCLLCGHLGSLLGL